MVGRSEEAATRGHRVQRPGKHHGGTPWPQCHHSVLITSNTESVFPFQVLLPACEMGLDRDSKAQAEQVRSVSVEQIAESLRRLTAELMAQLDEALRLPLAL